MIFRPFPRFVAPISAPPPLAIAKVASMKHSSSASAPLAKLVGDVGQNLAQNLVATPGLEAPMHSFVVRIALRQHVPLCAGVQNPKHRFKNQTRRNRLTARTAIVPESAAGCVPIPNQAVESST